MGMLDGKVVVVAGVGPGLGRETAEVALREGAQVAMGARSEDVIEAMAKELDPTGDRVWTHRLDVTDLDGAGAFMAAVEHRFGPVHGLVVSAALDTVFGGIEGADWDAWRRAVEVNFFGAAHMTSAALAHLSTDGASIVFVGSQINFLPPPAVTMAAYSASKSAVIGMMRHLVLELGPRGIRLNNVAPGWMWGPAVEGYVQTTAAANGVPEEDIRGAITVNLPLRDMATDGDVAEVIGFLLSDRSRGVTGQTMLVNAGEYML